MFVVIPFWSLYRKVTVNKNSTYALDEDIDVMNERKRVLRGSGKRDILRLENLTKVSNM